MKIFTFSMLVLIIASGIQTAHSQDSIVAIPDAAFLHALIDEGVDTNGDGLISYAEAEAVISLDVSGSPSERGNISNMSGIEAFINLDYLDCSSNEIASLGVSHNPNLTHLYCFDNLLTNLDVSNKTALVYLFCWNNKLKSLDVSNDKSLEVLWCWDNHLTSLVIADNISLVSIRCSGNHLSRLDISNNTFLSHFYAYAIFPGLGIAGMPSLHEVCVWWDSSTPPDSVKIDTTGSPNVYFTTECTDYLAPDIVATDTLFQPGYIKATSSEDGMIYLVPEETHREISVICGACIVSIKAVANTPVNVSLSGLENGVYWLYAMDSAGNLSEPEAFTIMGVGIENRNAEKIRIYPNPANNDLILESADLAEYSIEIISLKGRLLYSTNMEGQTLQIDLSSFRKGIYFIRAQSGDRVRTEKIIKL